MVKEWYEVSSLTSLPGIGHRAGALAGHGLARVSERGVPSAILSIYGWSSGQKSLGGWSEIPRIGQDAPPASSDHRTLTSGYRQYPGSAAGQTRRLAPPSSRRPAEPRRTGLALVSNPHPYRVGESRIRRACDGTEPDRKRSWTGVFLERG